MAMFAKVATIAPNAGKVFFKDTTTWVPENDEGQREPDGPLLVISDESPGDNYEQLSSIAAYEYWKLAGASIDDVRASLTEELDSIDFSTLSERERLIVTKGGDLDGQSVSGLFIQHPSIPEGLAPDDAEVAAFEQEVNTPALTQSDIAALGGRVDTLESSRAQASEDIATLQNTVTGLSDAVGTLAEGIAANASEIAILKLLPGFEIVRLRATNINNVNQSPARYLEWEDELDTKLVDGVSISGPNVTLPPGEVIIFVPISVKGSTATQRANMQAKWEINGEPSIQSLNFYIRGQTGHTDTGATAINYASSSEEITWRLGLCKETNEADGVQLIGSGTQAIIFLRRN